MAARRRLSVTLGARLPSQDLLHRLSLCQFVDELVQVANLLHQRVVHLFYANAANRARDERSVRVHCRRLCKKGLEVNSPVDLSPQSFLFVASEPANNLIDLASR